MHVSLRQARRNAKRSKECDMKQSRASVIPDHKREGDEREGVIYSVPLVASWTRIETSRQMNKQGVTE
jgi:hypothetical protein